MLKQYLIEKKKIINEGLNKYLLPSDQYPKVIHRAMRYVLFSGGKRLRPILVLMSAEVCGGKESEALPLACAMEMLHNYSLIHDDLPAMDNDEYRRGKLTCHKKFNEAIAILAGDALLTRAFEVMGNNRFSSHIISEIAKAIGTEGMIGGQVAELIEKEHLHTKTDKEKGKFINYVHLHKTGALIKCCLKVGAMALKADKQKITALENYGHNLGLAFQITDDILDVQQDKGVFGNFTYTDIYGINDSRKMAYSLIEKAKQELEIFGRKAKMLKQLADFVAKRKK